MLLQTNQHLNFTYQNIKRFKVLSKVVYWWEVNANFQFQVKDI